MIDVYIAKLVQYGLNKHLIEPEDKIYTVNQYLEIFKLDDYEEPKVPAGEIDLEEILTKLTDEAYDRYIIKSKAHGCFGAEAQPGDTGFPGEV